MRYAILGEQKRSQSCPPEKAAIVTVPQQISPLIETVIDKSPRL